MLSRSCNYFTKEILDYVSFREGGRGGKREREWGGGGGGGGRERERREREGPVIRFSLTLILPTVEEQARSNYHPV